ncbi:MAG: AAA family ATPase [Rhodobacter sp.]|uniref:ExeA family protein n=1 Tax=Pararhodobacter sp. TaxID=2127056 RepID=UPI002BD109DA|nr:AAA family ATPase [Pararhodobacter sp.]MCC0074756.1 AAA family ATPase [Rhodobacter sp.]HPD93338.1 AAA family ATPase [Pararhodobacter sp.]
MAQALNYYLDHFGLRERPFALAPDPEFLFWSPEHRGAYAMLDYGLSTRAPITLLTGEIGAGKTTLLHHFIDTMDDAVTIGMISNARPGVNDVLRRVCAALGLDVPAGGDSADLFAVIQTFLLDEHRKGNRVLLVIDEAQNLNRDALEDLRMLTNINAGRDEVLQLLLVGQPELRAMVRRADLIQFAQRVAASYHLPKLDAAATGGYIASRIRQAGGNPNIFSRQAADLVHQATGGVPRLINQLCDLALTYAFAEGATMVKRETVACVLRDGVFFGVSDPPEG